MRGTRALRRREREQTTAPSIIPSAAALQAPRENAVEPASKSVAHNPSNAARWTRDAAATQPLVQLDDKQRRRLYKNRDAIDARLDLHGLRKRDAYDALRSFVFNAVARGDRHVLVITGKGVRAETSRDFISEERGVLRRLVPQWLNEPEMRALVAGYTASHIRHGGDGALYVKLRRAGVNPQR